MNDAMNDGRSEPPSGNKSKKMTMMMDAKK